MACRKRPRRYWAQASPSVRSHDERHRGSGVLERQRCCVPPRIARARPISARGGDRLARVPAGAHAGPTRRTRARGTGAAAVRYFSDQDTTIAKRLLGGGPRRTRDPGGLARWSRCQAMADIFYRRPVARSVRVGDFGGPEPGGHLRRAARCHSHRSTFWPTRRDPPCNPMGSWKGLSGNSGGRRDRRPWDRRAGAARVRPVLEGNCGAMARDDRDDVARGVAGLHPPTKGPPCAPGRRVGAAARTRQLC